MILFTDIMFNQLLSLIDEDKLNKKDKKKFNKIMKNYTKGIGGVPIEKKKKK